MTSKSVFERISCALEEYYQRLGANHFRNSQGQSIFLEYIEENEFGEDEIEDELGPESNVEDCGYCDFDERFPFEIEINDVAQRENKIFTILQNCYKYNRAINQPIFEMMDNELAKYYKSLNRTDYYDINHVGKFINYINENEHEEEDIKEQLGDDILPNDCDYCEFDDNFPFHPLQIKDIRNDVDKKQELIFKILQHIYKNRKYPTMNVMNVINKPTLMIFNNDFKYLLHVDADSYSKTKELYQQQCPKLFQEGIHDKSLMTVLSYGIFNVKYPFLQYLYDTYIREKQLSLNLNINQFCHKNKFIHQCRMKDERIANCIQTAINCYKKRLGCFNPPMFSKISDDFASIANILLVTSQFVQGLMSNSPIAPFQFDLGIGVKKCIDLSHSNLVIPENIQNNYHLQLQSNKSIDNICIDELGDIETRLNQNNCVYQSKYCQNITTADLATLYRNFRDELQKHECEGQQKQNLTDYPQHKRICIFVDRRNDQKQRIFMYQLPSFNTLPSAKYGINHVPEWYFESIVQCYLPSKNSKDLKNTITSRSSVPNLLLWSFHVENENQIKLYLHRNGYLRFLPQDVKDILPTFFDKKCIDLVDPKSINDIIKMFKFRDNHFEHAYNLFTGKSI